MKVIAILAAVFVTGYFFDKTCLWLEKKGVLYYKNIKPEAGLTGKILLDLHAAVNPGARHVIEMKQNAVKHIRREADAPGDLKNA